MTASVIISSVAFGISAATFFMLNSGAPRQGELALAYACGRHDGVVFVTEGSTILAALDYCEKYRGMITALEHR